MMFYETIFMNDVLWDDLHEWCSMRRSSWMMFYETIFINDVLWDDLHKWCSMRRSSWMMFYETIFINDVLWDDLHEWCSMRRSSSMMFYDTIFMNPFRVSLVSCAFPWWRHNELHNAWYCSVIVTHVKIISKPLENDFIHRNWLVV